MVMALNSNFQPNTNFGVNKKTKKSIVTSFKPSKAAKKTDQIRKAAKELITEAF